VANDRLIRGGARAVCGSRRDADGGPRFRARALVAAAAEGDAGGDQRDGYNQPKQQRGPPQAHAPVDPAHVPMGRLPPARHNLLRRRHLLTRGQPAECAQQRGQLGVRTGESVRNRVQGLLFPCAEAHHRSPHRPAEAARTGAGKSGQGPLANIKASTCVRSVHDTETGRGHQPEWGSGCYASLIALRIKVTSPGRKPAVTARRRGDGAHLLAGLQEPVPV